MSIGNLIRLSACTLAVIGMMNGCGVPQIKTSWSKPGATQGEFERVNAECENDMGMTGLKGDAGYQVCMKRHGWLLIEEPVQ